MFATTAMRRDIGKGAALFHASVQVAKLLNMSPSKTVTKTPYEILHGKPASSMAKSIWILLAISAYYDYDIWQMDVKTAFVNGFIKEEIYMDQPVGFISIREEQKSYDFVKNEFDPCIYKKVSGSSVVFLVLYVDDILLIENEVKMLGDTKAWLTMQSSMKDLGDAFYILDIKIYLKIYRDRSRRILGMTQVSYIKKVLKRHVIAFALSVMSKYPTCAGEAHWTAIKTILKYLRRTQNVLGLNGGVVAWKSSKQDTTTDSTTIYWERWWAAYWASRFLEYQNSREYKKEVALIAGPYLRFAFRACRQQFIAQGYPLSGEDTDFLNFDLVLDTAPYPFDKPVSTVETPLAELGISFGKGLGPHTGGG
ncbi:UNVERIFIED_CONTAM: Copia protein [Sesamum calycinum]|uniref:Copia protein n=1 Tax=Sesamum calycinum TaxID=2727403 RepID=A0AAW2K0V3_9LAMI